MHSDRQSDGPSDRYKAPSPRPSGTKPLLQTADLQVQGLNGHVRLSLTREELCAVHAYLALWPHTLVCHETADGALPRTVYQSPRPCEEGAQAKGSADTSPPEEADCLLVLRRRENDSLGTDRSDGPDCSDGPGLTRQVRSASQPVQPDRADPNAPNAPNDPHEVHETPKTRLERQFQACGPGGVSYLLEKDPTAPSGQRQEVTLAAALCSLGIALVAHLCTTQGLLSMHGALLVPAADSGSGGLLLLGANRGGKSSLCVRLMALGLRSLGDDMLGLTTDATFFSLGLAPRLRLPLPPSRVLADFAARHAGAGDERAFFLQPDARYLEPFAGRSPVSTLSQILVLERVPRVLCQQPSVQARTPAQTLTELVGRFFMQEGSALDVLDAACRLAETVPCATFRYADLDEAAELLGKLLQRPAHGDKRAADRGLFFEDWEDALLPAPDRQGDDGRNAGTASGPDEEEVEEARADALALLSEEEDGEDENTPDPDYESSKIEGTQEYCRCEGVLLEQRLGTDFLVNPSRDGIHVLNQTGRIIWQLLDDPLSLDEACLLLEEVYPQTDPDCIAGDMQDLFADLLDAGLIRPC